MSNIKSLHSIKKYLSCLYYFHDSFLIYTLSKENQEGDNYESAIAAVVKRILEDSSAGGVLINSRITNVFKKKISTLHTAFKRASKSGGNALKKLVNGWKNGQKYRFKVFYNEVDVLQLKSECDQLRGEKRALEESVTKQTAKRICLEDKLQSTLEKAGKREEANKKRFKRLAKKVAEMNFEKRSRGPAKKKSFRKYTRQHQACVKNQLKEQCHATLSFLGRYDYVATKVEVYNEDTGKHETFSLLEEGELPFTENEEKEMTDEELDDLNMWMYLKDKFNISNEAWREFSVKAKDVPTLSRMTKRINELNSSWNLSPTPGKAEGVQIKFEDSLRKQIERLDLKETTIKVKLSGDGTQIGKRLKIVNFTWPREEIISWPLLRQLKAMKGYRRVYLISGMRWNHLKILLLIIAHIILSTFWGVIGNSWLVSVAWELQTKIMHVYGASVPECRGGIWVNNGLLLI